jgi:pyruvate dehydrogenase E1 component
VPAIETFKAILEPTAEGREISTTQAYVRFVTQLLRDQALGPRVVPILVDEARTFGMEGLFRQIGIYNPKGQLYTPVDRDQVMYYREDKAGQILQEGINEAGGMASWIAAATSYSTNNRIMVPFYVYYSMFGFQRIGDLAWAAGDMQARGFLLGGTSGRTTLNGEGLQHEDGHSHILANTIPNCVTYDPTFAHEVAVIMHHGMKRMVEQQENVFYYITLLNENYPMPGLTAGTEEQIIKGIICASPAPCHRRTPPAPVKSACSCWARAPSCANPSPPKPCWLPTGAFRPMCGAAPASTNLPAKARTWTAGTCCIRWKHHACRSWRSSWAPALAPWSHPPTT